MKRFQIAAACVAVGIGISGGCGDGTPSVSSSTTEATVKGSVTIRGKSATSGTVVFSPANIRRPDAQPRRSEIAKDGTYSITTLVGDNVISVAGPKFDRDEQVGSSQITHDVPSGESRLDITLPRPN